MRLFSISEFAAKRRGDQDSLETELFPFVEQAIQAHPVEGWYNDLLTEVARQYLRVFRDEGGRPPVKPTAAEFTDSLKPTLDKTSNPDHNTVERLSVWLSTAILNAGTMAAADTDEEFVVMEWVTMHDEDVRPAHRDTSGQQRPPGEPFDVDGVPMAYPGDPSAPIELWINCRCTLAPVLGTEAARAVNLTTWTHDDASSLTSNPTTPAASSGKEHPPSTVTAGSPSPGSASGSPTAGRGSSSTASGPSTRSTTSARPGSASTPRTSAMSPSPDRPRTPSGGSSARPTAQPTTSTPPRTPAGAPGGTARSSASASPASGREPTASGDPRSPSTEVPVGPSLAPVLGSEAAKGGTMTATVAEAEPEGIPRPDAAIPWYGVLAPEGVWSGDKRQFLPDSLEFRDLPLPLTWQKESEDGHKKSITVASIENIERRGNLIHASGTFMDTPEADEAIGLVAHFGRYGVSVDADDAEFEFDEDAGAMSFSRARISAAAIVGIPAFKEAFIALGTDPGMMEAPEDVCDPESENYDEEKCAATQASGHVFVSDKPWSDFSQSDYTPEQWKAACCLHRSPETEPMSNHGLPVKEPGGALNRNGVHAAAARFNQTQGPAAAKAAAKSCLRGAYRQIGEQPPDVLSSALVDRVTARRGPGWVTNPEDTRRLWAYWTQKGQPGYAKINWGVPGDFNRCRALVGEKIAANSPEDMRYLNQICAQWHHDALGWWPGRPTSGEVEELSGDPAPAISLVASSGFCAPSEWFRNPELDKPTPFTVTDEGRVFGHLAQWGVCHVGFDGVCVDPPRSNTDYAYFLTGEVETDAGPIPVGNITMDGPHAPLRVGARAAMAHYDNTCTVVADVTCGEDDHGIWVAGWVRPTITDEQKYNLKASGGLSGDWRMVNGHPKEMIAALAVNSGGFPIPRVGVENGVQVSLVAAGCVMCNEEEPPTLEAATEELALAVALHLRRIDARREKMKALIARMEGTAHGL